MASPAQRALPGTISHQTLWLCGILTVAFVARLGARMALGEDYFWANGYSYLYRLAEGVARGEGFCRGTGCPRPPLYTAFLAATTLFGKHYLLIVIPQAAMGAATAMLAYLIGRDIFDARTGLIACAIAALYPYYVMHDTALQDTAMVTFATTLAVWLILRARMRQRAIDWTLAGCALGATVLIRAAMAPALALVLLWILLWGAQHWRGRARAFLIATLAAFVALLPWLTTTTRATGSPVLSTDTGYVLWAGNNERTFSHYPARSIDRSAEEAVAHLPLQHRDTLRLLSADRPAISAWYTNRAFDYMRADPVRTLNGAIRKIRAAFSLTFNPERGRLAQAVYLVSYGPVAVLGLIGMVHAWRRRETALIALLYIAFMLVSAIFVAHSSHRAWLDIYAMVFAASVVMAIAARLLPQRAVSA